MAIRCFDLEFGYFRNSVSDCCVIVEQIVEVENVIVINAATGSLLEQLRWERPGVHMHTASDQEVDRAVLCRLHNHH